MLLSNHRMSARQMIGWEFVCVGGWKGEKGGRCQRGNGQMGALLMR